MRRSVERFISFIWWARDLFGFWFFGSYISTIHYSLIINIWIYSLIYWSRGVLVVKAKFAAGLKMKVSMYFNDCQCEKKEILIQWNPLENTRYILWTLQKIRQSEVLPMCIAHLRKEINNFFNYQLRTACVREKFEHPYFFFFTTKRWSYPWI